MTSLQIKELLVQLEIQKDLTDLIDCGLTQEELDGYVDFFIDNYRKDQREHFLPRQVPGKSSYLS